VAALVGDGIAGRRQEQAGDFHRRFPLRHRHRHVVGRIGAAGLVGEHRRRRVLAGDGVREFGDHVLAQPGKQRLVGVAVVCRAVEAPVVVLALQQQQRRHAVGSALAFGGGARRVHAVAQAVEQLGPGAARQLLQRPPTHPAGTGCQQVPPVDGRHRRAPVVQRAFQDCLAQQRAVWRQGGDISR